MALLEFVFGLLELIAALLDLASLAAAASKRWRLSLSLLVGASAVIALFTVQMSPVFRWLVGFHLFAGCLILGLFWGNRRGKL